MLEQEKANRVKVVGWSLGLAAFVVFAVCKFLLR
jgi:hypothetical protein